jgi:hypothetical protein
MNKINLGLGYLGFWIFLSVLSYLTIPELLDLDQLSCKMNSIYEFFIGLKQ